MHNRLKKIREIRGMKQAEVCHGILSASHYSNIEACRFTASADTMRLIAERLDVPYSYLTNLNSYSAELEELLLEYEKLIDLRNRKEMEQFLSKYKHEFQYIESISQEYHYFLLKFLELVSTNKIEEAVTHYDESISDIDTTIINYKAYKNYLYASGLYNYYKRNYKESIKFYLETIDMDKSYKSRLFYNISLCFYIQGLYSNALFYVKSANDLYLKEHKWDKVADCYNLISVIHLEMGDLRKAEKYIQKGLDIAYLSSKDIEPKLYHNLALIKKDQGDIESALNNTHKAIKLKKSLNANDIFISYRLKLTIFSENRDVYNLTNTLKLAENCAKTPTELALLKYFDAQLNWLQGNYQQYEKGISKVVKVFLAHQDWISLKQASEHYSLYLEKDNKYKKALEQQKLCCLALENIKKGK
ncbi:helix-turn-helix domain-containing protein [Sporosarcina luteola]|nr:helix-turn-helix transcriptional regulator [Sporosarcina luteola]